MPNAIPIKDAVVLSRFRDRDIRLEWRHRIEDHDGGQTEGGGIRRWLKLAEAVGLDPDYVASGRGVMPATRFAVDAYVRFVREEPLIAAMASSSFPCGIDTAAGSAVQTMTASITRSRSMPRRRRRTS